MNSSVCVYKGIAGPEVVFLESVEREIGKKSFIRGTDIWFFQRNQYQKNWYYEPMGPLAEAFELTTFSVDRGNQLCMAGEAEKGFAINYALLRETGIAGNSIKPPHVQPKHNGFTKIVKLTEAEGEILSFMQFRNPCGIDLSLTLLLPYAPSLVSHIEDCQKLDTLREPWRNDPYIRRELLGAYNG